jgi:hypothetical protein
MRTAVALLAVVITGCAMTYDAVQVGPNRFQTSAVASPARGGAAGALQMAARSAAAYCAKRGKQSNVLSSDTGREYPAAGSAVVTFECN